MALLSSCLHFVLILLSIFMLPGNVNCLHHVKRYSCDELYQIRRVTSQYSKHLADFDIPSEIKKPYRARGKRAGLRVKLRKRKRKPFVPSVIFGNVRSLHGKIDDLRINCRHLFEYREVCVIGVTETWLNCSIPDSALEVNGFHLVRSDRTEESNKSRGGGLAFYISDQWCSNICVKKEICTVDIELLSVSLRPYYLPREFTNIFLTLVYIPPDANKENAVDTLQQNINRLSNNKPDALHIICGDVNQCLKEINTTLHGFHQCVTCCTRKNTLLDPFYCNIKQDSYKSKQLPPLQNSDHNMIYMIPRYKPKLKQNKPRTVKKTVLNETSSDELNACFELTNWEIFEQEAYGDVNILTDLVTSYVTFCTDMILESKQVKVYPNNKPWVKASLRKMIVDKHRLYGNPEYQNKQKEVDNEISKAKKAYKEKIEDLFKRNNTKDAWRGLKILTGQEKSPKEPDFLQEKGAPDRLNKFYARFDMNDFSAEHQHIRDQHFSTIKEGQFVLSKDIVKEALGKISVNKAAGPDKISGRILKTCKDSLLDIIHKIFSLSFATCTFPRSWKMGEIVPVPKKNLPKVDNDLRPVTLTSILAKSLERVGLSLLMPHVQEFLDPLQFAYINKRSTDDAVCYLLHRITKHLDTCSSNTARILFIDFSSAFNTIQPHLMFGKLKSFCVPDGLCLWILDFLTSRSQYVRTKLGVSGDITLNTGAPQGCVLSPVLFVLYTNDMSWNTDNVFISKYADDAAIVGLIQNNDCTEYLQCIDFVNSWCANNYLELNVTKTKELLCDFRRNKQCVQSVEIDGKIVERTSLYTYLGDTLDGKLTFGYHVEKQVKKANSRLYFMRCMRKLNVSSDIIAGFYNSSVASILSYSLPCFYGFLSNQLKNVLDRPYRKSCKIVDKSQIWTSVQTFQSSTCPYFHIILF